jgi:3-hydroxybutyryl-CoA dehydrogenase
MTINSICVCGAGTMGSGIAQVAAQAGFNTILYELNDAVLDKAKTSIAKSLQSLTDKGKITEAERIAINKRLHFTNDLQTCRADACIEAIIEKTDIKITLFNQLAAINSDDCIFASNTSSLSITALAEKIRNPARVAGLHFFNPAPIMKLVEVVKTPYVKEEVIEALITLAKKMGKTPVVCKDAPGFIVNRVARPYYIESLRLAEEGITSFAQADALLEATGFRMGPFKLMDLIGNDVNLAVSHSVYDQLNKPARLKPSVIQEQHVMEGKLGRKSGKGYYDYNDTPKNQ